VRLAGHGAQPLARRVTQARRREPARSARALPRRRSASDAEVCLEGRTKIAEEWALAPPRDPGYSETGSMIALAFGPIAYVIAKTIRGGLTIDAEDAA